MQKTPSKEMFYQAKVDIFSKAALLRNNMTLAEKKLWQRLSKNQLGVRFKAQHPIDIFIVDFYCHKLKLVIEVDGLIHNEQKDYDEGREKELENWDLFVIRFTNDEVINDIENVILKIKEVITSRVLPPTP